MYRFATMSGDDPKINIAVAGDFTDRDVGDACQSRRLCRQPRQKVIHCGRRTLHFNGDSCGRIAYVADQLPLPSKPVDVRTEAHTLNDPGNFDGLSHHHESTLWQPILLGCGSRFGGQRSNVYPAFPEPPIHFPGDGHAARRIGVDADRVRFHRQFAAVASYDTVALCDVYGLLRGASRFIEQCARQSTLAQRSVRLVGAVGESFGGTLQSYRAPYLQSGRSRLSNHN